jgi:aspartate kinase
MKSNVGVAHVMFETLAKKNINIKVISTSEIKISVLIESQKKKNCSKFFA